MAICKAERRIAAVRDTLTNPQPVPVNGMDYLEIVSFDQRQIDVFFVHPLPGQTDGIPAAAALSKANFRIEGGDRITGIRVTEIIATTGNRIRLQVNAAGDFSAYVLRLVRDSADAAPPTGFDPQLASVEFLFKAGCPSIFDCAPVHLCPPEQREEPRIDYLAKDYAGFRRVMLDRLSALMPEWQDRSPADPYVAMVEALVADMKGTDEKLADNAKRDFTFQELVDCCQENECFGWAMEGTWKKDRESDDEWLELNQKSKSALGRMWSEKFGGQKIKLKSGLRVRFGHRGRNRHRRYTVEVVE